MRVKGSVQTRQRRKKILKLAKGYVGSKGKLFRVANEQLLHSLTYSYRDRRNRKRDFRNLWIKRVNAAATTHNWSYSQFIKELKLHNINLNRKMLAEVAYTHPDSFQLIINEISNKKQ